MDDFQKESWVSLFQSALVELEHARMSGRIKDARSAIADRIEKLRNIPGLHATERTAIEDALRTLRFLEQDQERFQAEARRTAVEHALKKLRSVAPTIERLQKASDSDT